MNHLRHGAIRRKLVPAIEHLLTTTSLPIKLRDHQREAYKCMLTWLRSGEPGHRRYIAHATGMGKTLHFLCLVIEALKKGLRSLIVVSSQTLVVQTAREIYNYTKGAVAVGHISSLPFEIRDHEDASILYATRGWQDASIVIITQDSFRNQAKRLAEGFDPHLIIRDEMHWSYTDPQLHALDCFPESIIIGYSATPDYLTTTARSHYVPVRLDNGSFLYADPNRLADTHFGSCLHRVGLREGIERRVLAKLAWGQIDLSSISLDDVPVVDGPLGYDYDPASLAKLMEKHQDFILGVIERMYATNEYGIRDIQVAAACPSVAFAKEFARIVGKYTRAASITSTTHPTDRQKLLAAFEADEDEDSDAVIHALSSVFVLREGWDSRKATMLLFLRATKSRVLYEQFLGRILRQYYDGKPKTAIVLDPRYQQSKFSPLSAPMLYGVPGEQVTRGGILIGPRTSRGEKRILSPYLQEGIQSTITVKPLEIEYWTDEKGLVEIEGETWGTETGLAEALDLAEGTIRDRASDCHSRPGRCANGRSATLYLLRDVKKACANLIGPGVLQTGPDGTVWADGEIWGGVEALAPILLLSPTAIRNRKAYCRSRPGKGPRKRLTLYALKDMRKACADILPARGKN